MRPPGAHRSGRSAGSAGRRTWRGRLRRGVAGVLVSLTMIGPVASAADWGGIQPGVSTTQDVEALYGPPVARRTVVEEDRSAPEWTYTGTRAPQGVEQLTVSFGLTGSSGFRADVVRAVTLYPRPRIFTVEGITAAWGKPDAIGTDQKTGQTLFRYDAKGLLVVMHKSGEWVEVLLFTPPAAPVQP